MYSGRSEFYLTGVCTTYIVIVVVIIVVIGIDSVDNVDHNLCTTEQDLFIASNTYTSKRSYLIPTKVMKLRTPSPAFPHPLSALASSVTPNTITDVAVIKRLSFIAVKG